MSSPEKQVFVTNGECAAQVWRTTADGGISKHSYGVAIDLNTTDNYCLKTWENGTTQVIAGSQHGGDYEIPFYGDVDRIMYKYGFQRGIWYTYDKRKGMMCLQTDYMHYSYLEDASYEYWDIKSHVKEEQ